MKVVAEGNVVFQQGDQKIVGDRVEVSLEDGTGKFYDAYGNAGSDFFFHGDVVEKVDEDTYVVEHGAFTSCAQPTPRWRFTSWKATVRRDHHVSLHNAFVRVKSVPVFYVPYLYYPIDEKGRSTGFLLPQIGNSSLKGFLVSQSFFWAINRSMDATFTADYFGSGGLGGGVDYRYVFSGESRGQFESYFLRDKETERQDWQIRSAVNQGASSGFQYDCARRLLQFFRLPAEIRRELRASNPAIEACHGQRRSFLVYLHAPVSLRSKRDFVSNQH